MRKECTIFVGENPIEVGKLSYEKKGQKSTSAFLYSDSWLRNPDQFALSPDLPLISGYQFHSARRSDESPFLHASQMWSQMAGARWSFNGTLQSNEKMLPAIIGRLHSSMILII